MPPQLSRTLRVPGTIEGARAGLDALDGFAGDAGLTPDDVWTLRVALDEWLTNVARHAYGEAATGAADLCLSWDGRTLTIEVADTGPAFDPLAVPPPDTAAPIDARAPGGLGVFFITRLMSHVAYRRDGDRNILRLECAIPSRQPGERAAPRATAVRRRRVAPPRRTDVAAETPRRTSRARRPR